MTGKANYHQKPLWPSKRFEDELEHCVQPTPRIGSSSGRRNSHGRRARDRKLIKVQTHYHPWKQWGNIQLGTSSDS
ncbi:uncharacterized protein EAF01_010027 [Botrytis porri]|uniref:Uncharacterized protein n=1 Tax=Botrytis porri TaxID=87229 RepID=A0A4Z1KCT1_9HELO|nr:uncharacterized protein EAF01_010027 [Botrytis porri]KAF7894576.1 hypothetical protein EAF01_010027 [Botrytis porri]TGO81992.1 hypothetical protein BPOR_0951g00010 [Botrytis porri]